MAQTLKFGSGTWATKKGSILAHNDEDGNFKPLPFTYTGAGKGTRVNKEGLIEVVENDRPRIDYTDSEDGVFLLEKASTNLFTYSEDFIQDWISGGAGAFTITPNAVISPDGTQNASKLIALSVGHQLRQDKAIINTQMSNSFYMRTNQGTRQMSIRINDNEITETFIVTSEWKRYTVSGLVGGTLNGSGRCSLNNVDILDENNHVYIYGAQLEVGNLSSYIPTQGNPQTRVQETASGSGNSEVFNSEQGVLYLESSALADDGVDKRIAISDGTMNNYASIGYSRFTGNIIAEMFSGGVLQTVDWGATGVTQTNSNKFSLSWGSGTMKFYVNGFQTNTETVASPIGINVLDFAAANGTIPMYSKTKEIGYYDEILTDLELETLTSYRTWEEMVKELNLNIIHNE
jgi:hypothetical protein